VLEVISVCARGSRETQIVNGIHNFLPVHRKSALHVNKKFGILQQRILIYVMALGLTQALTEMSIRNFPGGQTAAGAQG
jgi:hypothetical protein